MAKSEHKKRRNRALREEFNQLASKKVGGVRLYTSDAIIQMLSDKFFLAPGSIRNILYAADPKSKNDES